MTTNNAALRVAAGETDAVRTIDLPAILGVHIPALDETRYYDLSAVTDEQLIDMLAHGMSQKLTDAAAGKKDEKAVEAVDKREKTLWAVTGTRGSLLDPVTRAMYDLTLQMMSDQKVPTKKHPKVKDLAGWLETQNADSVAALRETAEAKVAQEAALKGGLKGFEFNFSA